LKSLKNITILALLLFGTLSAEAKVKKNVPEGQRLSTDVSFDGRLVKGKYQYSTESITTVENEKGIDDLIGVRKNFKDRLQRSEDLR
jgi:hypothetical protein